MSQGGCLPHAPGWIEGAAQDTFLLTPMVGSFRRRPCRLPSPPGFDPAAVYEEEGGGWIEPPCGLEGGRRSGSDPEGRVEDDGAADRQPSLPLLVDEGLIDAGDQIRREPVLQDDL